VQVDDQAPPKMFAALHQWALSLRDLGEVSSAISAARSLCREAGSVEQSILAHRLLAELHLQDGDPTAVTQVRERLVELTRRAADLDPSTDRMFDLLTALDDLGDLARQQGDHWTVLECYGNRGRMAILRHLVQCHGLRPSLLTEQCYSLRRAGAAASQLGSHDEARSLLTERLTVARLTFAGDPSDRRLIPLVAAALSDLGSLLARRGDPQAGALLAEELCLREWLQSTRPDDVRARQDLANCHLAITATGPDTGQHLMIATRLLSQIEAEGELDIQGRILLSDLRERDRTG
jgi:tetratricopeptide (TPR) repeat protein